MDVTFHGGKHYGSLLFSLLTACLQRAANYFKCGSSGVRTHQKLWQKKFAAFVAGADFIQCGHQFVLNDVQWFSRF